MLNGVAEMDFVSVNGRVFTATRREPFNGSFGVGLPQALFSAEPLTPAAITGRFRASFKGDPNYDHRSITVAVAVRGKVLDVELGATAARRP